MLNPSQPFFYLVLYLVVLYVRPHEYVSWLIGLPILPILLVTSTALWMARQPKNFNAPQFKLLPVQTFLMAWSVLMSGWFGGFVKTITDFFPVIILFYMIATSMDSMLKLRQIFVVLSLVMLVIALHSIGQAANEEGIGWTGAVMVDNRITYLGFLNDPNDLSMALLMVLPMILYLAKHSGWVFKLGWLGVAFAVLFALKLANSRGAILALALMTLHFGIYRYGLIRSLLVVPLMLLPILVLGPSRMSEISSDEESAEGRIDAWYEGFYMLKTHPLFGVGKGMFTEHNNLTAHNSYVLAMSELGLVGFFIWLSGIVLTWLMAARVQAESVEGTAAPASEDQKAWADIHEGSRILLYGYTGALASMFFLSRSYLTILYVHMALIVGIYQLARVHRPNIERISFSDRWGRLLGFSLASVMGLWVVTMILLRTK